MFNINASNNQNWYIMYKTTHTPIYPSKNIYKCTDKTSSKCSLKFIYWKFRTIFKNCILCWRVFTIYCGFKKFNFVFMITKKSIIQKILIALSNWLSTVYYNEMILMITKKNIIQNILIALSNSLINRLLQRNEVQKYQT